MSTDFRKAFFQFAGVFVGIDRSALLQQTGTGIEAGSHLNDRVARFGIAIEDCPLHGGRAAVFRQERTVQVDAAEAGGGERFRTEDFTVITDDEQVGRERGNTRLGVGNVDRFGGPDFKAKRFARPLQRARLAVSTCGRPSNCERDFVPAAGQRTERRNCERAGAKHDDAHGYNINLKEQQLRAQSLELAKAVGDFIDRRQFAGFLLALECEFELFELVSMAGRVRRAEAIDEERTIEVIGFVLSDAGHQAVHFAGDFIALEIVGLNLDAGIPSDRCADAGDAEAAFFVFLKRAAAAEDGVDENGFELLRGRIPFGVGDEQAIRQIDLVGGQADTLVLVHQLEHFVDEFTQLGVDTAQGLGAVAQGGVRILDDLQTHGDIRSVGTRFSVRAGTAQLKRNRILCKGL